jgi:hypothetical protein
MKTWHRYVICVALGLISGAAYAVQQVRGGLNDGVVANGAWETGKSFGTLDASTLTRAKVALSGLLALPAKEAMYFTAQNDSDGRALDGRCTYDVRGGQLDGRWWSVTLYEGEGWLVKNAANRWSIPASAVSPDAQGRWSFTVSPDAKSGSWLPTGSVQAFDLTLRLYHPSADIIKSPETAQLPIIDRKGCA